MFVFWINTLLLILIALRVCCQEVIVKQPQIAVAKGDYFEVQCSVDQELKGCYIKTPKNEIRMIFHGAKYDNNRIFQVGNIGNECGIRVFNANPDIDYGRWECGLSILSHGKSISVTGRIDVWVLTPPTSVELETVIHSFPSVPLSIDVGSELSLKCMAKRAYPQPKFLWFLGKYLLKTRNVPCGTIQGIKTENTNCVTNDIEDSLDERVNDTTTNTHIETEEWIKQETGNELDHIQVLNYHPGLYHNGKSLRCLAIHQTFNESKSYYYDSNRITLDIRYPPVIIGEKTRSPKEGLLVVRINFKSNPVPNNLFWTLPTGIMLKMGERSVDNRFASGIIHPISHKIIDEWIIELWIDVKDLANSEREGALTLVNDVGTKVYSFSMSTKNSFWTMPILIAISMGGVLFLVGVVTIVIFLLTQKIQDIDSNSSESDSDESSSLKCDEIIEDG